VSFLVNRAPDTPAGLSVPSVADHRPTLRVTLSDPDGAQPITPVFQVRRSGDAEPSWEWQGGSVLPGSHDFVWGGQALPSGLLEVRAVARNTADSIPEYTLWSPASGWVAFQVGPPGPTITSSAWPADGSWLGSPPADAGFTFTAVGAVRFSYRVDDQPAVEVAATGGTAQVSLQPVPGPGGHTLTVTALDAGGNRSPPATFRFGIGQATISTPVAQARSSRTFRIRASAPAGMTGASIQWRAVGSSEWTSGPSNLDLTSTADSSSLVYVWDTTRGPGAITQAQRPLLIELRVTFANPTGPLSAVQQLSVTQSFGGAYATVQAGPCAVSVATGECQVSAVDADLPGYGQSLSVGRAWYSQSDLTRRAADDRGVFGPGWVADLPGADGSGMSATVSASIGADPVEDWIALTYPDGLVDMFTRTMAGDDGQTPTDSFEPVGESRQDGSRLQLTGSQLQLFEDDGTITTWTGAGQAWTAVSVTSPGVNVATRFLVVTTGGVEDRAAISGVTTENKACAEELTGSPEQILTRAKATPGCRVLETVLARATTAAPGAPGAFAGQVDRVLATYFHPDGDTGAMASVELARYAYDTAGRLVAVWDPRISPPLVTRYSYTPGGQLRTVGPASAGTASSPAIIPWVLDFNAENRLTTASRERPDGGTAVTRLVPLDPAADGSLPAGLPNVRPGEVARWAGTKVGTVTTGVAVFGPDHPVSGTPDAADWPHAQLSLVDSLGRQILDGEYGAGQWLLNTNGYTADNAVTWQLTAANRARIGLDGPCTAAAAVCAAGGTATRADLLASITSYDPAQPSVVTDTWGPAIDTVLDDGRTVTGRAHTHTRYYFQQDGATDDPATGLPWRVPVRTTESTYLITGADPARVDDNARDVDAQVTTMTYAASIGGQDGLAFRTPNTTTLDDGGLNLVTRVALDSAGRTVVEAPPGHDPDDAGATHTTYYTATGSFAAGGCEGRPAWVGMVCATTPGGPISAGVAAPSRRIDYDQLLLPRRTTLTANGATTTTEITRDPAGRETRRTVTGGAPGDTPVGPVVTRYDPNTGQVATTWDQATNLVQASRYDPWARPVAFTDQATANANGQPQPGTGNTTTTSYDDAGRVAATNDGVIRTQYRYDQPGDHRGLVSELFYTRSSGPALYAAAASYDIDGQPDNAQVGPGLRLTERSDAAGNTTTRRYESDAGTRLAAWTSLPSTAGQIRDLRRAGTQGAAAGQAVTDRRQTFTYDHADRLVRADDQTSATDGTSTCTVRDYTYRPDGARTGSSSGTAGALPGSNTAATCSGSVTGTATRTHSVNAWAQLTATTLTGANPGSGSYTYDPLGRVVGLPAVDSPAATPADTALGYYADGLPHSTTISTATRTWTRDPAGRLASWTDTAPGQPDTGGVNHYDDPAGDSPAWTRNNDGTTTTWLTGPDGTLATSVTIAADGTLTGQGVLIDPLGTTTATQALATDPADTTWSLETLQPAADIDEYGITLPGTAPSTLTGGPGNTLGWHAQNQRPTNTSTALVTLGVRQYNPETGQFLAPDPIPGGNTTPYTHPQDPINQYDLDGRWCFAQVGTTCTRYTSDEFGRTVPVRAAARAKVNVKHNISWGTLKYLMPRLAETAVQGTRHEYQGEVFELRCSRLNCVRTGRSVAVFAIVDFRTRPQDNATMGPVTAYCLGMSKCPAWINSRVRL
jgi:RHS repeat-associated protein